MCVQGGRSREQQSLTSGSFQIAQNLMHGKEMSMSRKAHKLAQILHIKANIRMSDYEVEQSSNQASINNISKRSTRVIAEM